MIHYVNNVTLSETEYSKDKLNPVVSSNISEIISEWSSLNISSGYNNFKKGILIYDAICDNDLCNAVLNSKSRNINIFAGSAGVVPYLVQTLFNCLCLKLITQKITELSFITFLTSKKQNPA